MLQKLTRAKLAAGGQRPTAAEYSKWKTWNTSKTRKQMYENIFLLNLRPYRFSK